MTGVGLLCMGEGLLAGDGLLCMSEGLLAGVGLLAGGEGLRDCGGGVGDLTGEGLLTGDRDSTLSLLSPKTVKPGSSSSTTSAGASTSLGLDFGLFF